MRASVLLRGLPDLVRPQLPRDLRDFRSGARWSYLMKLYYGNELIHYEASHHSRARRLEIGLHFESDELTNARLLGAFRSHERAVHRRLPGARIEEWDRDWARVWEPVEYEQLDEALGRDLAARLAAYIAFLEPILRAELPDDVEWEIRTTPRRAKTGARSAVVRAALRS